MDALRHGTLHNSPSAADSCEGELIGLGILALIALFNRKKNPPQPQQPPVPLCADNKQMVGAACICKTSCGANQTQNPESCACTQNPPAPTCAPKVGTPPNCVCPVSNTCTPGQQIYDQVTCQCTNVPQPVKCPNGSNAPNNNLNQCPKCLNGTPVPVGGCPVAPGPGEGGTGNNCPAGNCNSGGPPAGKTGK